jgi:hypothetical protein
VQLTGQIKSNGKELTQWAYSLRQLKRRVLRILKKIAEADNVKPKAGTGFKFSDKTTSEITAGATNSRTAGDDAVAKGMEAGRTRTGNTSSGPKGGTITEGTLSYPRMQESASRGSRARADRVAKLDIKKAAWYYYSRRKRSTEDA